MFEPSISSTQEQLQDSPPPPGVTFGQATHQGRLRESNQDHHATAPDLGMFVVADGVGGAPAGAVAARLAVATMLYSLRHASLGLSEPDSSTRRARTPVETHGPRLVAAAHAAHKMIRDFATNNACEGAATTMAALWVTGSHVHVANTGDSRVYRLCGGRLEQLTRDHTAMQDQIDKHGPTARKWRLLENVVTQVLGGRSRHSPAVHLQSFPVTHREVFLLCTDGLNKMVDENEIALVLEAASSPQRAADALIELANDAGGLDNITCIVVHVDPPVDAAVDLSS
jgi:serine/threonine protein phosphatase PrpC